MDKLFIDTIGFPVRTGTMSRYRDQAGVQCWSIEIQCGESPDLDYQTWTDDRVEGELDWLAGSEPWLCAQILPLPADSPDELVGQTYDFPQTPEDDPADWDRGQGWLFFCLYLFEGNLVYPVRICFSERRENAYRVNVVGSYPSCGKNYDLRVEAWLTFEQ